MNVTFYSNFKKKDDSTKQPTGGVTLDCKMKSDCSLERPTFLIDGIDLSYNYCFFNGRYYFVTDIVLNKNNIYEISCNVDVLPTYKSDIGNYTGYIERASDDYDPYLYDSYIVAKRQSIQPSRAVTSVTFFDSTGSFIFPVMNKNGIEIFCTQYLEDWGPLFMPGTYGLTDFSDWLEAGISTLTDLSEKFGKVIWVPFTPTQLDGTLIGAGNPVSVGTIAIIPAHDMYKLSPTYIKESLSVYRIQRPTAYYNDFRDMSGDWIQYTLYIPGVGTIPLDPVIAGNRNIDIFPDMYFEPQTGDFTVRLNGVENYGQSGNEHWFQLGTYKGNMSAIIPWGDSQFAAKEISGNLMNGLTGLVGGIASGNYVGAVAAGVSGIAGAGIQAFAGSGGSLLSGGGGLATAKRMKDFVFTQIPLSSADIPNAEAGRPLCKIDQIGNHTGYLKMGAADVDIAGFEGEKAKLNSILKRGFYYE